MIDIVKRIGAENYDALVTATIQHIAVGIIKHRITAYGEIPIPEFIMHPAQDMAESFLESLKESIEQGQGQKHR